MFNPHQPDEQSHAASALESYFRHYGRPTRKNMTEFFGVKRYGIYMNNDTLSIIIRRAK
jgi:hypothetical protein